MRVEYSSNNSGGDWWLSDKNWLDLESAGWKVKWFRESEMKLTRGERFLGALAAEAEREGLSLEAAVEEWERITGQTSTSAGCACCGQPHRFTEYSDDGKRLRSGPEAHYECSW